MKNALLLLLLLTTQITFAQEDWKLAKDRRGVKVYTKREGSMKLKKSKTIATVTASVDEVYKWLTDIENHKEWMDKVATSEVLAKPSENEVIAYYVAKAPWPASDRDIVVRYTLSKGTNTKKVISVKEETGFKPEVDGLVRVPMTNSQWVVSDIGDGKVKIIYETISDPGGNVPDWMANTAAEDNPFNTVSALIEKVTIH